MSDLEELEAILLRKCDKSVVTVFIDYCNDQQFDEKTNIADDIEDISESCICDHMQTTLNWNNDETNEFINILKNIITYTIDNKDNPEQKELELNDEGEIKMDWNCFDNKNKNDQSKTLDETENYLRLQFYENNNIELDDELLKLFSIGRINNMPYLLSMINNIYNLSQIQHIFFNENYNFNETIWIEKECPYFSKYKQCELIKNALRTYSKRICPNSMCITYKINDFLMDYIKYILIVNNVIANILTANKCIVPLQIDLCILGRNYQNIEQKMDYNYMDNMDDNSDDDIFASQLNAMASSQCTNEHKSSLDDEMPSFNQLLSENDIKYETAEINLETMQPLRIKREIQKPLMIVLASERFKRICILIDRTNGKEKNDLRTEKYTNDKLYIYKIPIWSEINHNYCSETLLWKTKKALIPTPNEIRKKLQLNKYIGTDSNLFDRKFVTSYHINSETNIRCIQHFGLHSFVLLPFHLTKLFPHYFNENYNKIDKNFQNIGEIYTHWVLPIHTKHLMQWISFIDPKLYQILMQKHQIYIPQNNTLPNYTPVVFD